MKNQQLTVTKLLSMVDTDLDPGVAVHRITRHYCKQCLSIGQCSHACQDCKVHLCNIFTKVALSRGRDPVGNLVYACREEVADIKEAMELSYKPEKTYLWNSKPDNIFTQFEASFDTERTR